MRKYRLWIGFYESITNYQICLVSNKLIAVKPENLVRFLRWLGFHNTTEITFIGQRKNKYIDDRYVKYSLYETFMEIKD